MIFFRRDGTICSIEEFGIELETLHTHVHIQITQREKLAYTEEVKIVRAI